MEPTVQLDPERCILVLGPQVAAECLSSPSRPPAALSYNMLLEAGVQKMLDSQTGLSNEEKIRKRALLVNAYELDPSFVGNVVVNSLKRNDSYTQWLEESFSTLSNHAHTSNQFVEKLQALQKMGVLLIYTYYDVVLDQTLGTPPVLMENEEDVHNWANRQFRGILHIHGIHSKPDTVCCGCVNYEQIMGGSRSGRFLRDFCKSKTVIFAGFDGEFYDPFMPKFSSTFVDTVGSRQPPLLISCMAKIPNTVSFLTLKISHMASLERILLPSSPRPAAPRESLDSSKQPLSTTLHYADMKSCQEAAEHVKTVSSINVHQLTMRHELSHELELFLDRGGLKSLWEVLFSQGSSKLTYGLLGLTLGSNFTVWLKIPTHVRDRTSVHMMTVPSPSLSTNVSVIPSGYTPIASPSVSQPLSKHLAPSTRPTLPSPLVTTTTRSLIGIGKTGHLLPPELQTHPPLLNPKRFHSTAHLRKAKSYYDRSDTRDRAEFPLKKNGLLTHRESAPEFMYTPEGVIAYQSIPRTPLPSAPKPTSVSQPSPLLRDGSNIELKIEYIDQYRESKSKKDKKTVEVDHKEQILEYIHDAKQWSKNVEAKLPKKPLLSFPTGQEGGSLLLNSNVTAEEQEKFLKQHFETIQRSLPPQLKHTSSANRLSVAGTHNTRPSLSPSRSPGLPPRTSQIPTSLQLPSIPTLTSSMNPMNPFFFGQTGSPSMFPFIGSSPTILGTSDYLSPVTAALPQLASSPINPYQAMMHFMSQQGGKKPMVVTDPSIIQGLQGNLPDAFPCLLPNGTIAMFSAKMAMQKESEEMSTREDGERSPQGKTKRVRTPEMEREFSKPMPKRRRSNSLPDIYHLSQTERPREQPIQEEAEEPMSKPSHDTHKSMNHFPEGLRPRELHVPPLSMMHMQQDLKVIPEQMLGYPTPQSSPCPVGGFGLSQFIVSTPSFAHHQPMTPVTPNDSMTGEELKEFVEAGDARTPPPPPEGNLPPFPQGRGPIQLWQFLLDLLISPDKQHMIQWTGNGYEFRIILPEEIAKLWGARKNKPRMNYDKLSRGLRYYYSKGIMDKVPGKKLTFKYTCDVQQFIQKRNAQGTRPSYAATPLTPISATPDIKDTLGAQTLEPKHQNNEGNSPHSITTSVFHRAMSGGKSPLFSSPMLFGDSKLGVSIASKSPSPDSPDTLSADEDNTRSPIVLNHKLTAVEKV